MHRAIYVQGMDVACASPKAFICLVGPGDLVSRLVIATDGIVMWLVRAINLLTKSP